MNTWFRTAGQFAVWTTLAFFAGCSDDNPKIPETVVAVPTITEPAEGAVVASPITVSGTAEASAAIDAMVVLDGSELGSATTTADANGNYTLSLPYAEPSQGRKLDVHVTQQTELGTSEAASVTVVQGIPPAEPDVTTPLTNEEIDSPVTIAGTGVAGLTVRAKMMEDATSLGEATATIGTDGTFSFPLTYAEAAPGTELTVRVTQSNEFGVSNPVDIDVRQFAVSLSGTVSQSSGEPNGTVYLRVYGSDDIVQNHIKEIIITDTPNTLLPSTPYTVLVGRGTYYVRAFRDASGPNATGPDLEPTLPSDPQAALSDAIVVTDNDDPTLPDVEIIDVSGASFYRDFNVFANNESARAQAPWRENPPSSGDFEPGEGICGGFFMFAEANLDGSSSLDDLSSPWVTHPNGSTETMLDDGGCGSDVANNTDSSYDWNADDDHFSFGWPAPDTSDVGDYVFAYRNIDLDLVHIQVDTISAVTRLSRRVPLTSPTGAAASTTNATYSWDPVPNAASYQMWLNAVDGAYHGSTGVVTATANVPLTGGAPLDDHAYQASIHAYDVDLSVPNADYDARSNSISSYFVIDDLGDDTVTITGGITNLTDISAPIYVAAFDYNGPNGAVGASVLLDPGATSYALTTLVSGSNDASRVEGFLDIDDSGDVDSEQNRSHRTGYESLDGSANITQPLTFTTPVTLLSPSNGATGLGTTPELSWEDYTPHAPSGDWTYGMFAQTAGGGGGLPPVIWALPKSTTSFDFASPPGPMVSYDVIAFASCLESGGTYDSQTGPGTATCTGGSPVASLSDLSSATLWQWGVVIIECNFNDYIANIDLDNNNIDDFSDCLGPVLMGGSTYAQSADRSFSTD
ncbi:MAG: hypothetical protein H6715_00700 [Myxococcales bacterium]|nr:hypothetical protein [Myxococcales bacterium]MCB9708046.1 hypothetical protein [Myxococcales bacterium]